VVDGVEVAESREKSIPIQDDRAYIPNIKAKVERAPSLQKKIGFRAVKLYVAEVDQTSAEKVTEDE